MKKIINILIKILAVVLVFNIVSLIGYFWMEGEQWQASRVALIMSAGINICSIAGLYMTKIIDNASRLN